MMSWRLKFPLALLVIVGSASATLAQELSLQCRALKCLTSPYGPGMAPSCEKPLALIKQSVVRGEGLPVCDGLRLNPEKRDFSSHWYWRSVGWESCNKGNTRADHPYACGAAIHESLPDRIDFEIGSGELLTATGLQRLGRVIEAVKSRADMVTEVRLTAVVMSRDNDASEELAKRRNQTVIGFIHSELPSLPVALDSTLENSVVYKPLEHAVNITVKGRGVRPDRSVLGLPAIENSSCGTVNIKPGSVRQLVDSNIRRCGYIVGSWRFGEPNQNQDFIENHSNTVEVGNSIEQVLEYFDSVYGIDSVIDGARIEFTRRN